VQCRWGIIGLEWFRYDLSDVEENILPFKYPELNIFQAFA